MGLDILAYADLEFKGSDGGDDYGYIYLYPNHEFPGRNDGLGEGWYSGVCVGSISLGYTGYSWLRDQLAQVAGWPASPEEWADHKHSASAWKAKEGPFWELINFSDCEGVIGPGPCAKLAKDFDAYQAKADAMQDARFLRFYNALRDMTKAVGAKGCLSFS